MKKILITGITGFVGKNLAIYLHQNGYEIYGLGRTFPEKEDWHEQTIKAFYCYDDAIDYNHFDTIVIFHHQTQELHCSMIYKKE